LSVVGGQLSVASRQLLVVGGQLSVVGGQLSVASRQLLVVGGQLSVVSCRSSVVSDQVPVVRGQWWVGFVAEGLFLWLRFRRLCRIPCGKALPYRQLVLPLGCA
jgi:hypothetical protein